MNSHSALLTDALRLADQWRHTKERLPGLPLEVGTAQQCASARREAFVQPFILMSMAVATRESLSSEVSNRVKCMRMNEDVLG